MKKQQQNETRFTLTNNQWNNVKKKYQEKGVELIKERGRGEWRNDLDRMKE